MAKLPEMEVEVHLLDTKQIQELVNGAKLVQVMKAVSFGALSILLFSLAVFVFAYMPYVLENTGTELQKQLTALRGDATSIVAQRTDQALAIIDKRTGDALKRVDKTLKLADDRTGQILEIAKGTESDANERLKDLSAVAQDATGQIVQLRGDLSTTLAGVDKVLATTNDMVTEDRPEVRGLLRDSRLASAEIARTSIYVRQNTPSFLTDFHGIEHQVELFTTRAASTADNIDKLTKPHWYDRALGYGLNGVIMYRNLNPVTNLTIKGAQLITGRP